MVRNGPESPGARRRSTAPRANLAMPAEIYSQLRELAARYMRRERRKTLNPNDLVHEAYLKLALGKARTVADRVHMMALVARAMRQVLVDRARARATAKRGAGALRVRLTADLMVDGPSEDVLILHRVLERLEQQDEDAARVVEYRFFGGLTEAEIGEVMDRSERWVRDQWAFARAWLRREMAGVGPPPLPQKGSDNG